MKNKESIKEILKTSDFIWVELLNKEALERESILMSHCLARDDTPHYKDVQSGKFKILSLRKNNKPHITLKYNVQTRIITDLVGKGNSFPYKKYDQYIQNIVNFLKLKPNESVIVPFNKMIYKENKGWETKSN